MGIFKRRRHQRMPAVQAEQAVQPNADITDISGSSADAAGVGSTVGAPGADPGLSSGEVDSELPMLTVAQSARLHRLAHQVLAELGHEAVIRPGYLELSDGASFGLHNLATHLAQQDQQGWDSHIRQHMSVMVQSKYGQPEVTGPGDVYLRLRSVTDLPGPVGYPALEPLPGLLALACVDYPTHVVEQISDVEDLGGWESVRPLGLANLAALPTPIVHRRLADPAQQDSEVFGLHSDDVYGASRLLVIDQVLRQTLELVVPQAGLVVAVPNRHLLLIHVVTGPGVVPAMARMAGIADEEYQGQPGPLSPHLFHLAKDYQATQITEDHDGQRSIMVQGTFRTALHQLGLIDEG